MTRPARRERASEPAGRPPEAAERIVAPARTLTELVAVLAALRATLDNRSDTRPRIEPLTLRIEEVADAIGISRRAIERERSAGRFPRPDVTIGRVPMWKPATVRAWIDRGGGP